MLSVFDSESRRFPWPYAWVQAVANRIRHVDLCFRPSRLRLVLPHALMLRCQQISEYEALK